MRAIYLFFKSLFFALLLSLSALFVLLYFAGQQTDEVYKINRGESLIIGGDIPVTASFEGELKSQSVGSRVGESFSVQLKLFGVIPLKTAEVQVVDEMYVSVLGSPFGMKLYTEGVLVIELADVSADSGDVNPAKKAGIKVGDYILSVNGRKIGCNEDLSELVGQSGGKTMKFTVRREKKTFVTEIIPVKSSEDGGYKIGLWVRDSSAGIGTLTFYSPKLGVVCGLGHGICDSDTGDLLSAASGELVEAKIVSVKKGGAGSPGELKGKFTFDTLADISLNSDCGVYGILKGELGVEKLTEIALKQEVEDGYAQILCTVEGSTPKLYDCSVKVRNSKYHSRTQNLIVTVTDKQLLSTTGGIVQGMSGSPIIQKGKLIGALTHVLIDDPTKGYGIFAENMLETAKNVEQLKEAG